MLVGIPFCRILIGGAIGIFRLRSFFASRRSYCAQDDSVRGEMGLAAMASRPAEPESDRGVVARLKPCPPANHSGPGPKLDSVSSHDSQETIFRPAGACCFLRFPTACAVGCILAPLRGWGCPRVSGRGWECPRYMGSAGLCGLPRRCQASMYWARGFLPRNPGGARRRLLRPAITLIGRMYQVFVGIR